LLEVKGRGLVEGECEGRLLISSRPLSFYGGVDPETGVVVDREHDLYDRCLKGVILVFPYSKGSTVGSYTILRLARRGLAPAGIVNLVSEPIVVIGCILGGIPLMDKPSVNIVELRDSLNGVKARMVVEGRDGVLEVLERV